MWIFFKGEEAKYSFAYNLSGGEKLELVFGNIVSMRQTGSPSRYVNLYQGDEFEAVLQYLAEVADQPGCIDSTDIVAHAFDHSMSRVKGEGSEEERGNDST